MTDPATLPATEAARRIRAGSLSATALTEALLARIAAREPEVPRLRPWLDPALALRGRRRRPMPRGPRRDGRARCTASRFGVKDVLDTADQPSQYGSPIWAGHRPRSDAACVALGPPGRRASSSARR